MGLRFTIQSLRLFFDALQPDPALAEMSQNLLVQKTAGQIAQFRHRFVVDPTLIRTAVRLGRLAVAKAYQRQGIGKTLPVVTMGKSIEIFNAAGGIGLFVDAKDQDAKRYYEQFGFVTMTANELELFLPVKSIREALNVHP